MILVSFFLLIVLVVEPSSADCCDVYTPHDCPDGQVWWDPGPWGPAAPVRASKGVPSAGCLDLRAYAEAQKAFARWWCGSDAKVMAVFPVYCKEVEK